MLAGNLAERHSHNTRSEVVELDDSLQIRPDMSGCCCVRPNGARMGPRRGGDEAQIEPVEHFCRNPKNLEGVQDTGREEYSG